MVRSLNCPARLILVSLDLQGKFEGSHMGLPLRDLIR